MFKVSLIVCCMCFLSCARLYDDGKTSNAATTLGSLQQIDHVALNVRNLETSAAFYKKVFGLELVHKWASIWLLGNEHIRIGLFQTKEAHEPIDPDKTLSIAHVAFSTNEADLKEIISELDMLAIAHEPPMDVGIANVVFFHDPDGHTLEIISYYDPLVSGR